MQRNEGLHDPSPACGTDPVLVAYQRLVEIVRADSEATDVRIELHVAGQVLLRRILSFILQPQITQSGQAMRAWSASHPSLSGLSLLRSVISVPYSPRLKTETH